MSRQTLAEVIEPRVEELYLLIQQEIHRSGYSDLLSSGIVITGGSSSMPGMVELAEEILHMPVRLGMPQYIGGLAEVVRNPRFSTGVGLLLAGRSQYNRGNGGSTGAGNGGLSQVWASMKNWFQGNF